MKIPKSVKVGGQVYDILFPHRFQERLDRIASAHRFTGKILIGDDDGNGNKRTESSIIISLIHEIMHAIAWDIGQGEFGENEPLIEALSHSAYQVLVDNGWLKVDDD